MSSFVFLWHNKLCKNTPQIVFLKSRVDSTGSHCCAFLCINRCSGMCIHASCWCVVLVCSQSCDAYMSKALRHLIVTEYPSIRIQLFLSHSLFFGCSPERRLWFLAETRKGCILGSYVTWAGPWWTWFYYTGPVSQTTSQSASFQEEGWERVETHMQWREGAGMNGSKTSIPSSQSQSTEPLKWCRMSQEACRVELGEGGPNVTVPTLKSVPVNYHKWHDGLEKCYWTL